MQYQGIAQDRITGREAKTRKYDNYQDAHMAAERIGRRKYVYVNVHIYVIDADTGERQ